MATKKKMLEAAAGGAGGAGLDITEVFSTYLYTGNGSTQTINNGIDLAGEGGLIWIKQREASWVHLLQDTTMSRGHRLDTATTAAIQNNSGYNITSISSTGFGLTDNSSGLYGVNGSAGGAYAGTNAKYASWTFRKAPKFFDVVTYTGVDTSGAGRTIAHNLGSVPGTIIIKRTDSTSNWPVYHRSTGNTGMLQLNKTNSFYAALNIWNNTSPTDTEFTISDNGNVNSPGGTYVAYVFAHNDSGDGEFGPDGDQDIIKCGSFEITTGSTTVNVGFEPQFILHKRANASGNWVLWDTMRGYAAPDGDSNGAGGDAKYLYANLSNSEATTNHGGLTSNGFVFPSNFAPGTDPGDTYIYMAIRRGQLAPPTAATEVFAIDTGTGASDKPKYISNFPVDMAIITSITASEDNYNGSRLAQERYLVTNSTAAESGSINFSLDYNDGWFGAGGTNRVSWMWKRAPGYFDVSAYTGTGSIRTVSHNLTVPPEMMWVKKRDSASNSNWSVYHKDLNGGTDSAEYYLRLETTNAETRNLGYWDSTSPTDSVFTLGSQTRVNGAGNTFIAYLFASLDGVSKVSSYTGNGSNQTINAGFTTGARFIMIKRIDSTGDWYVWDTARGIVAGNDPHLSLNTTAAEVSDDSIDPDSSGFIVNQVAATNINVSSATYIYYAVA